MRYFRLVSLLLSIAVLLFISALFASCGGGGGGGGGGGPTYVNSRATGTYEFVFLTSGSTNTVEAQAGIIVFDGMGNGTYSTFASTASDTTGAFTYTVQTDNTITLDGAVVGTMRADGSFFAASMTTGGPAGMLLAVKLSSGLTDTANTYTAGQFSWDNVSATEILRIDTLVSSLTWSTLFTSGPSSTGMIDYVFSPDGSVSLPTVTPTNFGAITPDFELMIMGDAENTVDNHINALCGFKLATSASVATLNGTYIVHEFADDFVLGGGFPAARRGRVVFDGNGNGSYTVLAASNGPTGGTEPFTYVVLPGGTFQILTAGPTLAGVVLQDGSVFGVVDYVQGAGDNTVGVTIGVRQP